MLDMLGLNKDIMNKNFKIHQESITVLSEA